MPRSNLFVRLWNPRHEDDPKFQYEFPYLEDAESVQIGFMQLIHGVAQELLKETQARFILSALHGAASNLRQMNAAAARAERASRKKRPPSVKVAEVEDEGIA